MRLCVSCPSHHNQQQNWIMFGDDFQPKKSAKWFLCCFKERPRRSQRLRGTTRSSWRTWSGRHWCESLLRSCKRQFSGVGQSRRSVPVWVNPLSEAAAVWTGKVFFLLVFILVILTLTNKWCHVLNILYDEMKHLNSTESVLLNSPIQMLHYEVQETPPKPPSLNLKRFSVGRKNTKITSSSFLQCTENKLFNDVFSTFCNIYILSYYYILSQKIRLHISSQKVFPVADCEKLWL